MAITIVDEVELEHFLILRVAQDIVVDNTFHLVVFRMLAISTTARRSLGCSTELIISLSHHVEFKGVSQVQLFTDHTLARPGRYTLIVSVHFLVNFRFFFFVHAATAVHTLIKQAAYIKQHDTTEQERGNKHRKFWTYVRMNCVSISGFVEREVGRGDLVEEDRRLSKSPVAKEYQHNWRPFSHG